MKKRIFALLSVFVLATALLAACSSAEAPASGRDYGTALSRDIYGGEGGYAYDDGMFEEAAPMPAMVAPAEAPAYEAEVMFSDGGARGSDSGITDSESVTALSAKNFAEKIIYSHYAFIETLEFDDTLEKIDALIAAHGGFIENSSIQGSNYEAYYYGWPSHRSANFTIRIPVDQLDAVTGKLDTLGNVVSHNSNAENITSQFYDTESRLNALRVQEERLLDMLKKADEVSDLITIEAGLSEVRYQIERLTTTLMQWQQQVDYSTLTLNIAEVEELQEHVPIHRTYWERMRDGIIQSLRDVGRFFTELFLWLVVNAPVLIILAAIGFAVLFIVRSRIRKSKAKAEERWKNNQNNDQ